MLKKYPSKKRMSNKNIQILLVYIKSEPEDRSKPPRSSEKQAKDPEESLKQKQNYSERVLPNDFHF